MKSLSTDEFWMSRCLQLARLGRYGAPPNPMVGAVIVCDGRVIGEGYHRRCGQAHAEVNAFASVDNAELLRRSQMYVSLEPCAHWGRTPPCAQLIIDKGIPEVIVGCQDPFAKVNGAGIRMLREAGVRVRVGILEKECQALNRKFFTCQQMQRPYILLKWAQSADGFLDRRIWSAWKHDENTLASAISTNRSQLRVQRLRAESQAILVGTHTAWMDNPRLSVRTWASQQPLRCVVDCRGILPSDLRLFDGSQPTLVFGQTNPEERSARGTYDFVNIDGASPLLPQLLGALHERQVQSLLVEGGSTLLQTFLDSGLWDEIHVEIGAQEFQKGTPVPRLNEEWVFSEEIALGSRFRHYFRS